MEIAWDEAKNRTNQQQHGLSFEGAQELFVSGADYLEVFDERYSQDEDRFIVIGPIRRGLVVIVSTEPGGDIVRTLSASWATKREQELYFKAMETS